MNRPLLWTDKELTTPTGRWVHTEFRCCCIRAIKLFGTSFGMEHLSGYEPVKRHKVIFNENPGSFDENPKLRSSIGTPPKRMEYRLRDSNARRCSVSFRGSRVTRKWNRTSRLVFPTPSRKLVQKRQTHFWWHGSPSKRGRSRHTDYRYGRFFQPMQ